MDKYSKFASISHLRTDYTPGSLSENDLDPNPIKQFERWYEEALAAKALQPNAMTLATATKDGRPSARIVLLRSLDERGFVFFTNYESQKARELAENPEAALVFYWAEVERQVRITGSVTKVSVEESESYFRTRPVASRLSAWASRQSEVIKNRKVLEDRVKELMAQFQDKDIPLPPYWGGYRVLPGAMEFWQGRPSRLHDRFRYTRRPDNSWLIERLAP